ncbi:hypothetical protein F5Y11DRAFT_346117 [Daldinia sp. FL1419]|nr:hypothetical protein F5Y11DRAFT_346117 [Daldinia sp. FL1419]
MLRSMIISIFGGAFFAVAGMAPEAPSPAAAMRIPETPFTATQDGLPSSPNEPLGINVENMHMPRCVNAIIPAGGADTFSEGRSSATEPGALSTAALAVAVAALVI